MKTVVQLNKWANSHTSVLIDTIRIATGLFLVFKGFQFSFQTQYLDDIFNSTSIGANLVLEHYIAMSHIAGGFLIVFGLLTRWALIAQLPILVGAVIINFLGVMNIDNSLGERAIRQFEFKPARLTGKSPMFLHGNGYD